MENQQHQSKVYYEHGIKAPEEDKKNRLVEECIAVIMNNVPDYKKILVGLLRESLERRGIKELQKIADS